MDFTIDDISYGFYANSTGPVSLNITGELTIDDYTKTFRGSYSSSNFGSKQSCRIYYIWSNNSWSTNNSGADFKASLTSVKHIQFRIYTVSATWPGSTTLSLSSTTLSMSNYIKLS